MSVEDIPNEDCHVDRENDKAYDVHRQTHDFGVLRCRIAMENNRIVPAQ